MRGLQSSDFHSAEELYLSVTTKLHQRLFADVVFHSFRIPTALPGLRSTSKKFSTSLVALRLSCASPFRRQKDALHGLFLIKPTEARRFNIFATVGCETPALAAIST